MEENYLQHLDPKSNLVVMFHRKRDGYALSFYDDAMEDYIFVDNEE